MSGFTVSPPATLVLPEPGDFILCHRKGLVSSAIRLGERLCFRSGSRWSHAAYYVGNGRVVEALAHGVQHTPLEAYRDVEYVVVHSRMGAGDVLQASRFAKSCVGQSYGWLTILGVVLWALTPGKCFAFVANHAKICSGLVAGTQTRGWAIYPNEPSIMTPAGLAEYHQVPDRSAR